MHACSLVRQLGALVALVGLAHPVSGTPSTGPLANLQVPQMLRRTVEKMWRTSPTFRRQCLRLTEASMTVTVYASLPRALPRASALARIEIEQGVARHATVYLGSGLARVHEALAHEIEHVLEQVDGVDLRALVASRVDGVREEHGTFETARAAAVGRLVAQEVSSHTRELTAPAASSPATSRR